jgi:uncharacterized membrane protein
MHVSEKQLREQAMQTERGLDRLTYFTDAIAAIAITLLILPIVDHVADSEAPDVGAFLSDNIGALGAFTLSFVLIARFWMVHHNIFEHVASYSPGLRALSLAWAFTIALLPLPSAMLSTWDASPVMVAFYIGTLTANSALLTAMTALVYHDASIADAEHPVSLLRVLNSATATALLMIALVVGTLIPAVNYFALLLLFLSAPTGTLIRRSVRRRTQATPE